MIAGVRLGAGAGLWLSLLLVTYWWAAGGGLQDLAGWQDGLTSLGRLTGLVAADLLVVQVLLMARVPVLERAFGQDQLVHRHRLVGFTSFNLMLAHVVLITWGYAAGELGRTPATFWDLVTGYPGMLLALAGQFLTWRFLNRQGWTRGNPYSLSAAPDGRSLRITIKELGDNSAQLWGAAPGYTGPVRRALRTAHGPAPARRRVALIGAGIGVAPLRALAEGLAYAPGDAVLLHRFTDRPLFEGELHRLVGTRGLQVLWLPGHRRAPAPGSGTASAPPTT